MKDKSGYSRIIKMMQKQGAALNREGLMIATMKSDTVISYKGVDLTYKDDYLILDTCKKHKISATDTGGFSVTIEDYGSGDTVKNNYKKGDTVLIYAISDTQFILLGKVI